MNMKGQQIVDILKIRTRENCYDIWRGKREDTIYLRQAFEDIIWLKTQWTETYMSGVFFGARMLHQLENPSKEHLAETQCLEYSLCKRMENALTSQSQ